MNYRSVKKFTGSKVLDDVQEFRFSGDGFLAGAHLAIMPNAMLAATCVKYNIPHAEGLVVCDICHEDMYETSATWDRIIQVGRKPIDYLVLVSDEGEHTVYLRREYVDWILSVWPDAEPRIIDSMHPVWFYNGSNEPIGVIMPFNMSGATEGEK